MTRYTSTDRDTGVVAFQYDNDSITIKFKDGSVYLYTAKITGAAAIADMKALANKGVGLTTYINQHVRYRYQSKLK